MSAPILEVRNLGKCYQISHQRSGGYSTIRESMARKIKGLFGPRPEVTKSEGASEEFWALDDVSFDVRQGDVVSIIGRNGAGKSTLLKILSQITEPTKGRIRIGGRVASLLEVGTGFHPELTGRENIYLNGAILGMSRLEIKSKFDEIVAFADMAQFLDTPVKRYSSGMAVRLAFAVAAHLDPEILVIDEVLAVGDALFQKRCMGKMSEVARSGRTVLFVSHNMAAVRSLTTSGIVLSRGKLIFQGPTDQAVEHYTRSLTEAGSQRSLGKGLHTTILRATLLDEDGGASQHYTPGTPLNVEVELETDGFSGLSLEVMLLDSNRAKLGLGSLHHFEGTTLPTKLGRYTIRMPLAPLWLASGTYLLDVTTSVVNATWDHYASEAVEFEVIACNPNGRPWDLKQSYGYGVLAMPCCGEPEISDSSSSQTSQN